MADIVGDDIAGGVVLICEELGGTAVVAEQCVGGLDDAACANPDGGIGGVGGDGVAGVLHRRIVQDDAALPLCVLGQTGVALHDDALPQLPVACIGERTAVHHQRTARMHDDAGATRYVQRVGDGECGKRVYDDIRVNVFLLVPSG